VRIVLVDNYDSFTYNLYQQVLSVSEVAADCIEVIRNDACSATDVLRTKPTAIILSPGPGGPRDAGICADIIRESKGTIPTLGVCLGHQVIADVFGGQVVRAPRPKHGYASRIVHSRRGVFADVPMPTEVGRYHSLMVHSPTFPQCLRIEAWADDGVIMGLSHRKLPLWGVQFHPESFLSRGTDRVMSAFLDLARRAAPQQMDTDSCLELRGS
jgi:anthranilate synthase/aminodeoxychorismate synthase-like glutamine amidotransferase